MKVKLFSILLLLGMSNYLAAFHVGVHTDKGNVRPTNEDRHVITSQCLAVFDGSAGTALSEYMKVETEEVLQNKALSQEKIWEQLANLPIEGQKHAGELALKQYDDTTEKLNRKILSTTAAVSYITNKNKLHMYWVGDSRIVLANTVGKIVYETEDHKPDRPDEKERLFALQAQKLSSGELDPLDDPIYTPGNPEHGTLSRVHGNIAISRAIGCVLWANEKAIINTPEFYEKDLDANDAFIINACDGLWDVFSSQ